MAITLIMSLLIRKIASKKKYNFPTEDDMKTFLLDKTYRVIAIGNPINQEKVTSLYVSYITKKRKFDMAG